MNKFLTKKNIAISSTLGAIMLLMWDHVGNVYWCTWGGVLHYDCLDTLSSIEIIFVPILSLPLLSLITYKMKEEVFNAWIKFTIWFVPLSMIAILLTPVDDGGSWSIPLKGPVALLTTGLFFTISLIIICWKHFSLRGKA